MVLRTLKIVDLQEHTQSLNHWQNYPDSRTKAETVSMWNFNDNLIDHDSLALKKDSSFLIHISGKSGSGEQEADPGLTLYRVTVLHSVTLNSQI